MNALEAGKLGPREEEQLEIHLRDGSVVCTTVQEEDQGVESLDRLDAFIEDVVGGAPRFVWIGGAYVHNRAITAIVYADADQFEGLELPEAA